MSTHRENAKLFLTEAVDAMGQGETTAEGIEFTLQSIANSLIAIATVLVNKDPDS